jgi:hypothetical protein
MSATLAARAASRALRTAPAAAATRLLRSPLRCFATGVEPDSHDDFKPKTKARLDDVAELRKDIDGVRDGSCARLTNERRRTFARRAFHPRAQIVKGHKVVLFMKGSPSKPMCGFSAQVVRILHQHSESHFPLVVGRNSSVRSPTRPLPHRGALLQMST